MEVFVSSGSAQTLGLWRGKCLHPPTTLYMLIGERCEGRCLFCAQATPEIPIEECTSRSNGEYANTTSSTPTRIKQLSRVGWPCFSSEEVMEALLKKNPFKRICLQTMTYSQKVDDVVWLLQEMNKKGIRNIPVSLSTGPLSMEDLKRVKENGITSLTIPLDCATKELFISIKGRQIYRWEEHLRGIAEALVVFGRWNTGTHLIIGLGETDREAVLLMADMFSKGVLLSLFAYTELSTKRKRGPGVLSTSKNNHSDYTNSEAHLSRLIAPPPLGRYRAIQLCREYIYAASHRLYDEAAIDKARSHGEVFTRDIEGKNESEEKKVLDIRTELLNGFEFNSEGKLISTPFRNIETTSLREMGRTSFMVRGCDGCNRPYYNETPRGPLYNYPYCLSEKEVMEGLRLAFEYIQRR